MHIKIRGGTARVGEPSLCLSCRHARVVKGHRLRDEIVECDALAFGRGRVTFPVTTCTEYIDRQHPSIREMEDIAWVLRTDSSRRRVGFVHARDLRLKDRYILPEE